MIYVGFRNVPKYLLAFQTGNEIFKRKLTVYFSKLLHLRKWITIIYEGGLRVRITVYTSYSCPSDEQKPQTVLSTS